MKPQTDLAKRRLTQLALAVLLIALLATVTARVFIPVVDPWFWPFYHAGKCRQVVVTGPVDCRSGLPGVVQLGMARSEVRRMLGSPLVEAPDDPISQLSIDSDEQDRTYYGGVFAWIQFSGPGEEVSRMCFDLGLFARRFGGRQVVALDLGSRTVLWDCGTSRTEVIETLQEVLGSKAVKGRGSVVTWQQGRDLPILRLRFAGAGNTLTAIEILCFGT